MTHKYFETLNKGRFETWTEKPAMNVHQVTQVHGVEIASLETLPAEADGMIASWDEPNANMAIKTADCMPIVIEGEKGVVFLHVGWRGLAKGILKKPEIVLINPQRVLIGPSIHVCCFEVTSELKDCFKQSPNFEEKDGKLFFNLQLEAKDMLLQAFPNLLMSIAPICTCCHQDFHSHRRDQTKNRNWNLYLKG